MDPERLLVVDDEDVFRESLTDLLRKHGYECDGAADAHRAADLLARRSYAAVISDLRMPGNEEGEFLARLCGKPDAPPVIVVTAYPSVPSAVQAVNLNVASYLEKPVTVAQLLPHIKQAVQRTRMRSAVAALDERLRKAADVTGQLREMLRGELRGAGERTVARLRRNTARELLHCLLDLEDIRDTLAAEGDGLAAGQGLVGDSAQLDQLSRREREVLDFILKGYRVPTIATQLEISRNTVRNHLKRIFAKLGVASQAELLEKLKPVSPQESN